LAVLEDLRPREVLWSGPARPGLPDDVRVVPDHFSEVGPLAGLHAGLEKATSDLLVVLAVDLPRMTADFLGLLLKASSRTCGAVAEQDGFFEPLGAVYPKTLLPLIARQIERKCYAFQEMISLAIGEGMLEPVTLFPSQTELFTNWNFIEDLSPPSS
jgi:molybdopterin-guanine dinucleotide biosynthesis protein A